LRLFSGAGQPKNRDPTNRQFMSALPLKAGRIADIGRRLKSAMTGRYLNAKGQIAWKASPWMLSRLADAEREVQDAIWQTSR
jgi:hypothetical protein